MSSTGVRYKNQGVDSIELRRRREEEGVQLRKQNRNTVVLERRKLSDDDGNKDVLNSLNEWKEINKQIIEHLVSSTEQDRRRSAEMIRDLLSSEPNCPINDVMRTSLIAQFVVLLKNATNKTMQFDMVWTLAIIPPEVPKETCKIIKAYAIPALIFFLESAYTEVKELAVGGIGNYSDGSLTCLRYYIDMGIAKPLMKLFDVICSPLTTLRAAMGALSQLFQGDEPADFKIGLPYLSILIEFVDHPDDKLLEYTCLALANFCIDPCVHVVINAGICPTLVKLLKHPSNQVVSAALQPVGNLTITHTQNALNCSVLPCLHSLLGSPDESIRNRTCWTIANITAGNTDQIQAVLNENIFPALIHMMGTAEFKTRIDAALAITNVLAGGTQEQIQYLVAQNCIPSLCDVLLLSDVGIKKAALNGLENILKVGEQMNPINPYGLQIEECQGLDKIKFLQFHENNEIYKKSYDIMDRYFGTDEEDHIIPRSVQHLAVFTNQRDANMILNEELMDPFDSSLQPFQL